MPCCDCCCPEGEECCKAPGPDGICCDPERCCGTEEDPICCSELDPIQFCCGEVCCNEGDTCCGEGSEASCCPEDEYCCDGVCQEEPCEEPECESDEDCDGGYCCDGVCQEEPCEEPCGEETLGDPCGEEEPFDPDTGVGYQCCYNQLGELGCFGFPRTTYACESDDWCSACGSPDVGGIETKVGPYGSFFDAGQAAEAWFNDNCSAGNTDVDTCDGGTTYYGFICCTDEAP